MIKTQTCVVTIILLLFTAYLTAAVLVVMKSWAFLLYDVTNTVPLICKLAQTMEELRLFAIVPLVSQPVIYPSASIS